MRESRRTVWLLGVAALLPFLVFAALQVAFNYRAERELVEGATLARAEVVIAQVDADLRSSIAALRVLATSTAIVQGDWDLARSRFEAVMAINPSWKSVRLIDPSSRRVVFATAGSQRVTAQIFGEASRIGPTMPVSITGIARRPSGCLCYALVAPVTVAGTTRYLIVADASSFPFKDMLALAAPDGAVAALVDRQGMFLSRTHDIARRLGTPATIYVRTAIKRGERGIYAGTTYEGLENYTAFATSPLSGWSAHIAVSSSLVDAPRRRWQFATIAALFVTLAFAAAMVWYSWRIVLRERQSLDRLRAAERMEAVGQLTGGIAHDFNNMLAVIMTSLELAKRRIERGRGDVGTLIATGLDGARRASELTQRLLAFSRQQPLSPAAADVNALVENMRELLHRTLATNIELRFEPAPVCTVFIDALQLENAVVNLAANARDAMPGGGTLTIRTATIPAGRAFGRLLTKSHAAVAMIDTGTGMDPDVAARAIEPFFSTKAVGKGTGLGLAQIYGFLQQSGGELSIETAKGTGTVVTMLLPCHDGPPETVASGPPVEEIPAARPGETVLLVEDQQQVRDTIAEGLRELGYEVATAADAAEASETLRTRRVDLLLSDVVMPGRSGRDFVGAASLEYPSMRVLLMTGYEPDRGRVPETATVLHKPFTIEALARAVRGAIDAGRR